MRQRPLLQPPGFPASYLNLPKIKKQGCPITHTLKVCNRPHNIALASFDPRQNDWPLISGPRSGLDWSTRMASELFACLCKNSPILQSLKNAQSPRTRLCYFSKLAVLILPLHTRNHRVLQN